eukprot:517936-Pelagomonas_calceolata.AAC.1
MACQTIVLQACSAHGTGNATTGKQTKGGLLGTIVMVLANDAKRLLYHCCVGPDSVYEMAQHTGQHEAGELSDWTISNGLGAMVLGTGTCPNGEFEGETGSLARRMAPIVHTKLSKRPTFLAQGCLTASRRS